MEQWEQPARPRHRAPVAVGLALVILTGAYLLRGDPGAGPSRTLDVAEVATRDAVRVGQPDPSGTETGSSRAEPTGRPETPASAPAETESVLDARDLPLLEGDWTATTAGPLAGRWGVAVAWTGAEIVAVGGVDDGQLRRAHVADVHRWSPGPEEWMALAELPLTARSDAGVVAIDRRRVVVWGGSGAGAHHADGAVLDVHDGRWAPMGASPLSPRSRAQLVWTGAEVLVFGGDDNAGPLADAAAYDPRADTWRILADLPLHTWEPRFETDGERVVLWSPEGHLAAYDIARDSWTPLPRGPGRPGRQLLGVGVIDGVVYASQLDPAVQGGDRMSAMAVHRLVDGAWERLGAPVAVAFDGPGRLISFNEQLLQTFAEGPHAALVLDPDDGRWERIARRSTAGRGWGSRAVWDGEQLVIWGSPEASATHASFWRPTAGS